MKSHIFTKEERVTLSLNKHIAKITNHSVSFTPEFKKYAVAESVEKGRRPQDIFITESIPVSIIGNLIPQRCLGAWRKIVKERGVDALKDDKRGQNKTKGARRKKEYVDESNMSDQEIIAYYKAKIAYTEAENDFLARTRGIPRMEPFIYHPGSNTDS